MAGTFKKMVFILTQKTALMTQHRQVIRAVKFYLTEAMSSSIAPSNVPAVAGPVEFVSS